MESLLKTQVVPADLPGSTTGPIPDFRHHNILPQSGIDIRVKYYQKRNSVAHKNNNKKDIKKLPSKDD